jgi:hypothetical protein
MSGKGLCADKRIERTVAYLLRCSRSTVPDEVEAVVGDERGRSRATRQPTEDGATTGHGVTRWRRWREIRGGEAARRDYQPTTARRQVMA